MAVVREVSLPKAGPINDFSSIKPSTEPLSQKLASDPGIMQSDFLKLLVAQMQNQNPMKPMDNLAFTTQLAQFSALEQALNTNQILKDLQNVYSSRPQIDPVSLIGKEIVTSGGKINVIKGQPISMPISLDEHAKSVQAALINEYGEEVARYNLEGLTKGNQKAQIIPVDLEGEMLPSGSYTLVIEAKDEFGKMINARLGTRGIVSSVVLDGGNPPMVRVGSKEIPISEIIQINQVQ